MINTSIGAEEKKFSLFCGGRKNTDALRVKDYVSCGASRDHHAAGIYMRPGRSAMIRSIARQAAAVSAFSTSAMMSHPANECA